VVVVRAGRRATDDVVVLVGIRHIVIRSAEHAILDRQRHGGGDYHDASDDDNQHLDHDNLDTDIDKHFDNLDDFDRRTVAGDRDSCHRPVSTGTRHHRLSHG